MDDRTLRQILPGAVCIAVGVLLLGAQADWWKVGAVAHWWPVVLIAIGVRRGIATHDGFLWVGWGGLLLLWASGVWPLRESWPLLLVLYGVAMIGWPRRGCGVTREGSRVG